MIEELRASEVESYIQDVWEDVVRDIDLLVQVESVEDRDHAAPDMPFGPAPREALSRALGIAERLGLKTHDCEGYLGFGDVPGDSDDYLATIAHSDIVPLGTGWNYDPLRVTRKDGFLIGRGTLDDKGPLVLSLYAAHFFARRVAETGRPLPRTLRCMIGANEETEMEDVEYYLEHYPQPWFCFTPDAVFPLICGEKGRFYAKFASAPVGEGAGRIVSIEGGTVANAIPGEASAVVVADAATLPDVEGIDVDPVESDGSQARLARIVAHGMGGHASMPEGTKNAIGMLVGYLYDNGLFGEGERAFLEFERTLLATTDGSSLGIDATDDVFDPLTCIGGTVRTECEDGSRRFFQTIDVRYPKSTSAERLCAAVTEVAKAHGCEVVDTSDMVPFFISPDSDEIRTLVSTYNEVTGRSGSAFTIGGGTYARHFERACAFGPDDPSFPVPSWVGIEHGPDEGVSEESLKRALKVYILAIDRLMRIGQDR